MGWGVEECGGDNTAAKKKKKENREDKQRRSKQGLERRPFGKRWRKELDKVVIGRRGDRRIMGGEGR